VYWLAGLPLGQKRCGVLMVHSAEWTPAIMERFGQARTQTDRASLLRRYGYGVPNFERAILNSLKDATIVAEEHLRPFRRETSGVKTQHMNLHILTWPHDELGALAEAEDGSASVLFIVAYRPLAQNSVSVDPGTHLSYGSSFLGETCGPAS
jgi:hypothetical protein